MILKWYQNSKSLCNNLMPILKLQWGLGNQMFQYALAYSLSQKYNEAIYYDGRSVLENRFFLANWTFRHYELDVFWIQKNYQKPSFLESRIMHPKIYESYHRLRCGDRYIREVWWMFISEFPRGAYLDGWFQSYRYFAWYESEIEKIFSLQTPVTPENQKYLDIIDQNPWSVISLHVRRGDYVSLSGASKWHGVCSLGYYETAITEMIQSVANPVFFIFSDDIAWCRENMIFPDGTDMHYIDHNGSQWHEDMRLMYSCHHHIIANSSFSWWWAYLGRNPQKRVIAPKKWLQVDNFSTQNLIPPSWTLL